jgi:putative PIG3 family NAD(P)H quinone oxidoreductase
VRVRVRATALNRADLLQRRGHYPAPPGAPSDIPGLEFAGEIEACGERVAPSRIGERVMGIVGGGAHAEKLVVHERACIPIPNNLGWEEAAAIPEAFLTSFDALVLQASLSAGETVLIPAAASGVGTAALQIAALCGATAIGLSRSPDRRARLTDLGCPHVFDPTSLDPAAIMAATRGRGVDAILELVGAASWPLDMAVLAERGRVVLVGTMGGSVAQVDLGTLMRKRATIKGTVLRSRSLEEKIALAQEFARRMIAPFETGRLRCVVDRVLPLAEIASAHEALEKGEAFGKIVLRVA